MTVPDLLRELSIPFAENGDHHHVTPGFVGIDCPLCSPGSGRFKLGIALNGRAATCWSCGTLRLSEVLSTLSSISEKDLRPLLAKVGLSATQTVRTPPKGRLSLPRGICGILPAHRQYLKGRGFNPDYVSQHYQVSGIGIDARLPWRLFIPITLIGKTVSWTTRSLSDKGLRYISARPDEEAIPHKRLLFAEDKAKHAVIVVEGPLDAMAIGDGAVATFGVSYTQAQVARIAKYPTRVIAFDSEPEAQRQAAKLVEALGCFPGRTFRVELSGKDPAAATKSEITELKQKFLS